MPVIETTAAPILADGRVPVTMTPPRKDATGCGPVCPLCGLDNLTIGLNLTILACPDTPCNPIFPQPYGQTFNQVRDGTYVIPSLGVYLNAFNEWSCLYQRVFGTNDLITVIVAYNDIDNSLPPGQIIRIQIEQVVPVTKWLGGTYPPCSSSVIGQAPTFFSNDTFGGTPMNLADFCNLGYEASNLLGTGPYTCGNYLIPFVAMPSGYGGSATLFAGP